MNRDNPYNLIFDFDGTLVDSFYAVVQQFSQLAENFNFHKIENSEIEGLKKLTSQELIKYLKIPIYKLPSVMQQAREALRNEVPNLATFISLPEVLTELHQLNCCLGILTSNSSENVVAWLKQHKLNHLFNFIHAESSYFGKKQMLKKIIKTYKMDSLQTFFIGDETRDIEAAQKCNVTSIAVSWGFNTEETLLGFKPDYLAKTPKDLLTIIERFKP
ncbi:MAG: HAD hydrolase-like protein [Tatlockia sp.]|nr:HAD hydrolase-like protein [Tatlockia sp.]